MILKLTIPDAIFEDASQICAAGMTLEDSLRYFIAAKAADHRRMKVTSVGVYKREDLSKFSGIPF